MAATVALAAAGFSLVTIPIEARASTACAGGTHDVATVSYTVNGGAPVTALAGNVHQGDHVSVSVTLVSGCSEDVTLAVYDAPSATFTTTNRSQQVLVGHSTVPATSAVTTLSVVVPSCYYQLDFVVGAVITAFTPTTTYHQQHRFVSGAKGGTSACPNLPQPTPTPRSTPTPTATASPTPRATATPSPSPTGNVSPITTVSSATPDPNATVVSAVQGVSTPNTGAAIATAVLAVLLAILGLVFLLLSRRRRGAAAAE